MIFKFEQQRLRQVDRPDLARKVRWISQEEGDGAGYDILSFDQKGRERFLEVKTTVRFPDCSVLSDEERAILFKGATDGIPDLPAL
jgi:hypothetical protein